MDPDLPAEDSLRPLRAGRPPRKSGGHWIPRSRWGDLPMVGPFGGLIMTPIVVIPMLAIYVLLTWRTGLGPWTALRALLPW